MRRRIGMVGLAIAMAFAGVVGAGGSAGADTTHAITVAPSTFLSDGQTVTVTGTGYTELGTTAAWTVAMCNGRFQSETFDIYNALNECDVSLANIVNLIPADASGHISVAYPVHTTISPQSGAIDCQIAPDGCVVLLAQIVPDTSLLVGAWQPVKFGTPPPPPPATIRDCAVTAWHDAKAGTPLRQVLRDFVRCVVKILVAHHH